MDEKRNYNEVPVMQQYQHKCLYCGELFLGSKYDLTCKLCVEEWREKIKDLSEEDREKILSLCQEKSKSVINFIISRDKTMNPDADEEEGVVDIKVLDIPIISGLVDIWYHGFLKAKEIYGTTEEKNTGSITD